MKKNREENMSHEWKHPKFEENSEQENKKEEEQDEREYKNHQ
jgi:hypothetical protein